MFEFLKRQKDVRTKKERLLDEMKRLERELALIYEEELDERSLILQAEEKRKDAIKAEAIFEIQADYSPDKAKRMLLQLKQDEEAQKYFGENIFNMGNSYTAKKNGLIDDFF